MCEEDVSESNEHCGECDNPCNGNCFNGECVVRKYAFLTEDMEKGNLGGLLGADEMCQQQASVAGLPGIYRAWLSTGSSNPESRFTSSPNGYMMPNGSLLATSWNDLTDGSLANKLNITQHGDLIDYGLECIGTRVWSNTTIDGETLNDTLDCQQWLFDSLVLSGNVGNPGSGEDAWTADDFCSPQKCNTFKHLYCFQQ